MVTRRRVSSWPSLGPVCLEGWRRRLARVVGPVGPSASSDLVAGSVDGDHPIDRWNPILSFGRGRSSLEKSASVEVDREPRTRIDGDQFEWRALVEQHPDPCRLLGDHAPSTTPSRLVCPRPRQRRPSNGFTGCGVAPTKAPAATLVHERLRPAHPLLLLAAVGLAAISQTFSWVLIQRRIRDLPWHPLTMLVVSPTILPGSGPGYGPGWALALSGVTEGIHGRIGAVELVGPVVEVGPVVVSGGWSGSG